MDLIIIIFTNLILCNVIIIIIFIIYIEGSVSIFVEHIGIIRPLSCFDCTNFKVSLVITIFKNNRIWNMTHLAMFVIFHMNVITCQIFNLSHGIQTWFKLWKMIFMILNGCLFSQGAAWYATMMCHSLNF